MLYILYIRGEAPILVTGETSRSLEDLCRYTFHNSSKPFLLPIDIVGRHTGSHRLSL